MNRSIVFIACLALDLLNILLCAMVRYRRIK
uniref:Uncharacterized protein n=1 Tax=Lepeophtheirus salmonis TaxID=72036 RepID=A0A0K2VIU7_LEPSM